MQEGTIVTERISPSNVSIPATDGYPLAAMVFEPRESPCGLVVVNSAVGVRQSYYARFASYLAGEGFRVVTYDYRGIGRSAPEKLRGFDGRMRDWGQRDFPGVLEWCRGNAGADRVWVVGHSVGGQILGLAPNNEMVRGLIAVCTQHTWWRHWPAHRQPGFAFLWYVMMPTVTRALGYFPSSRVGLGEDLPKGIALEWAQWARSPGHTVGAIGEHVRAGYENYTGSILAYSFADDSFAPRRATDRLLDVYRSAKKEHRHVLPGDIGRSVGHFGFFREECRDPLWRETADWLKGHDGPSAV